MAPARLAARRRDRRRPRSRTALAVLLPVLGAPLAHAPVLRFDLLPALARPLDGGLELGGRRLLGDNKTWRGALVMTGGTILAAGALWRWPRYRHALPPPVAAAGPLRVGLRLGLATVVGELPNSLLKRRLGIAPGARRPGPLGVLLSLYDQADFVPFAALLLRPVWPMPPGDVALACAVVAVLHVPVNLVGYAVGARREPL
jgi:CDP-2,3-bis-(O-geranylgeranyl)-sn-glycerol synthase